MGLPECHGGEELPAEIEAHFERYKLYSFKTWPLRGLHNAAAESATKQDTWEMATILGCKQKVMPN